MSTPTATDPRTGDPPHGGPALGLHANWRQFALLVTVYVFVGGMIGLERTVLPVVGTGEFGLEPNVVLFSFIAALGLTKPMDDGHQQAGTSNDVGTRSARDALFAGLASVAKALASGRRARSSSSCAG